LYFLRALLKDCFWLLFPYIYFHFHKSEHKTLFSELRLGFNNQKRNIVFFVCFLHAHSLSLSLHVQMYNPQKLVGLMLWSNNYSEKNVIVELGFELFFCDSQSPVQELLVAQTFTYKVEVLSDWLARWSIALMTLLRFDQSDIYIYTDIYLLKRVAVVVISITQITVVWIMNHVSFWLCPATGMWHGHAKRQHDWRTKEKVIFSYVRLVWLQVFWYHNAKIIDPQGMYGEALTSGIQIVTQRSDILRSQLTIVKVRSNHSGNYTCSPTMSISSSVIVHVISGKKLLKRIWHVTSFYRFLYLVYLSIFVRLGLGDTYKFHNHKQFHNNFLVI